MASTIIKRIANGFEYLTKLIIGHLITGSNPVAATLMFSRAYLQ